MTRWRACAKKRRQLSQERMKRELGALLQEASRRAPVRPLPRRPALGGRLDDRRAQLSCRAASTRCACSSSRPIGPPTWRSRSTRSSRSATSCARTAPSKRSARLPRARRRRALPGGHVPAAPLSAVAGGADPREDRGQPAVHGGRRSLPARFRQSREKETAAGYSRRSEADAFREVPASIRSMIARKIERLDEVDRQLLVAASVQGHEFDSAVISEALEMDPADVEERLDALEHVHVFVKRMQEHEFPDLTLSLQYQFVHVLYQNALYALAAADPAGVAQRQASRVRSSLTCAASTRSPPGAWARSSRPPVTSARAPSTFSKAHGTPSGCSPSARRCRSPSVASRAARHARGHRAHAARARAADGPRPGAAHDEGVGQPRRSSRCSRARASCAISSATLPSCSRSSGPSPSFTRSRATCASIACAPTISWRRRSARATRPSCMAAHHLLGVCLEFEGQHRRLEPDPRPRPRAARPGTASRLHGHVRTRPGHDRARHVEPCRCGSSAIRTGPRRGRARRWSWRGRSASR